MPKDTQDLFAELKALFATSGNWKQYRAAIAAATPPAVPYLGLSLQDLTFLETNRDTRVVDNVTLWGVDKAEKLHAVVAELQRFQSAPYQLKALPHLESYLLRGQVLTADEQDQLSFAIRPKNQDGASPRKVLWRKEFGSPRRELSSE